MPTGYENPKLTQPDRDMIDALRAMFGFGPLYATEVHRTDAERFGGTNPGTRADNRSTDWGKLR